MIAVLNELGVSKIVLMGKASPETGDQPERGLPYWTKLTLDAYEKYPDRVIPFLGLNPFRSISRALLEQLDAQLATGKFRGMGELQAWHSPVDLGTPGGVRLKTREIAIPMNSPGALDLMCLAARYNVVLMIHMDKATPENVVGLEYALGRHPHTKLVWAHLHPPWVQPEAIETLMGKYPNLYGDLSAAAVPGFAKRHSNLPEGWRRLYEKHNGRFMVGLDFAFLAFWREPAIYRSGAELQRAWLSQLSPETQRKFASENLERILAAKPASIQRCELMTR
jgi:hypothetical protein